MTFRLSSYAHLDVKNIAPRDFLKGAKTTESSDYNPEICKSSSHETDVNEKIGKCVLNGPDTVFDAIVTLETSRLTDEPS